MQVYARGLGQLASRVPVVACALEFLFTPQEHTFGFGVDLEMLEFRCSHRAFQFGRNPGSVVPLEGDLRPQPELAAQPTEPAIRSASSFEMSASRPSVRVPRSQRTTCPTSLPCSDCMFPCRSRYEKKCPPSSQ